MKKRILSILLIAVIIAVGFSVPSFAASLTLSGATYPTTLKQGDPFVARGIITSDYDITKVVIGAYNSSGKAEFEYTGLPGEKSYDINNVDYLLSFSKLGIGSYTYKIVASDEQNANVVLLQKTFTVRSTAAVNTLKLTGENYPTTMTQGEGYSVKGIISSNYNITKVVIGAYRSDGTVGFEYSAAPQSKSFNINSVDYSLPFSKLRAGTYTYKITASDTEISGVVLLQKTFTVTSGSAENTLKISGENYPTTMTQGEGYSVKGIISSNYNITKVVIGAYRSDGTVGFEYSAAPQSKSFNINSVDYSLPFSKLRAATYTYKITASDTEVSGVVLLQKTFTVTSGSAESSLKISGENYPTILSPGEGFSVTGIVTSDYSITKVVIGAYRSDGTVGFEYTARPGSKSYNIANVDYLLTFSKLKEGSYTYKIVASDTEQSNVVLLQKSFSVKTSGSGSSDLDEVNWDVVDISYWNTVNSWSRMADNLDAVILRIGYTYTSSKKMMPDSSFSSYYKNAKAVGIPVGCYYFSAATTVSEARAEADFVLDLLEQDNCKMEMPIYYDLETEDQMDLTQQECTDVARAFCDKLSAAGYYVGIYCNKYFARDELYASELSDFQFWIAEYNSSCTYNGAYGMWQYSETGDPAGINYPCDMNTCYYDYPSYIKANGLNGFTAAPTPVVPVFKFKTGTNLSYNESKKEVYLRNDPGLTSTQFISKYVQQENVNVTVRTLADGNKVGTGATISATASAKQFGPYTICLIGDTNSDSKINSTDALLVLQHTVGTRTLSGYTLKSADWNGDSKVNSADALEILKYSVGIK